MNDAQKNKLFEPCVENQYLSSHIHLLATNFEKLLGRPFPIIGTAGVDVARRAYESEDYVILSHNTAQDPLFNYANKLAQKLWELGWEKFITMPSRLSAETIVREEREKLLAAVSQFGFIDNYQGIRIASTGKRFAIKNAVVWNLFDPTEKKYCGQAAMFNQWDFL